MVFNGVYKQSIKRYLRIYLTDKYKPYCRNKTCLHLFSDKLEDIGTDEVLNYLETFGGWPILESQKGGNWSESFYNLEDLMINVTPYKVFVNDTFNTDIL